MGKILIIDDEIEIINLIENILCSLGYEIDYSTTGKEGLEKIEKNDFSIVLLDIFLPDFDGFELLRKIKEMKENLPVIILTGFGTTENIVKAIKLGADDFIEKPFNIERFVDVIQKVIKIKKLEKEISKLKFIESLLELNRTIVSLSSLDIMLEKIVHISENLFSPKRIGIYLIDEYGRNFVLKKQKMDDIKFKIRTVYDYSELTDFFKESNVYFSKENTFFEVMLAIKGKEKNIGILSLFFGKDRILKEEELKFLELFSIQIGIGIENAMLFEKIQNSYVNAIKSLINTLEARDRYTKGHSEEVVYYSILIGRKLGFNEEQIKILKNAAYLHDLGKVGIKDHILLKPSRLREDEFELIKQHPLITFKIIEPLNLREEEIEACLYHHERIDGSGYPYGLIGEKIPIYAKIIAVADAYSAMTSERPYRKKMSKEEAIEELKRYAGKHFDSDIVDLFIEIINSEEVKNNERN